MRTTTMTTSAANGPRAGAARAAVLALAFAALSCAGVAHAQATPQEKAQEPAPVAPASVATTNRFDGDWTIRIDCPSGTEPSGAKGYSFDFPASVLNGRLFGSRGAQGSEGALQVEGTIGPDGQALLQARGRTSDPAYAANEPPAGTPYSYDIQARFDDARGSGKRLQQRACDFTFARR